MKKTLALLLAVFLLTGLFVGCGNDDDSAPATQDPVEALEPEDYEDEDESETADASTEEDTRWANIIRGTWDGNTYTNTYLGLQFNMPAGWAIATDEDIATVMGLGFEFLDLDEGILNLDAVDLVTFIDMMATDPMTGGSVSITYERLVFPHTGISVQDYIIIAARTIEAMGMDVHLDFPGTTRIGGYYWYSYGSEMDIFGTAIFGRYFINIEGGFARIISIIYSDASMYVDEALTLFSEL